MQNFSIELCRSNIQYTETIDFLLAISKIQTVKRAKSLRPMYKRDKRKNMLNKQFTRIGEHLTRQQRGLFLESLDIFQGHIIQTTLETK